MRFKASGKIINIGAVLALAILTFSCQKQASTPSAAAPPPVNAQTPTEAYKALYAAVKAKDTAKIKQMMTKDTQSFAEFLAARQKQSIEKTYENGFTATTFASTLPEIRDERVKDNFGAIEVYNQKENKWEDLPFIKEEDGWKLAIGDVFKNTYKSPGKGQDQLEKEAANNSANNMIPLANANGGFPSEGGGKKSIEVPPDNKARK